MMTLFPTPTLPEKQTPPLFSSEEARSCLHQLMEKGWHRLKPEYDDPINLLYDNLPANEWTMGWAPNNNTLYLIIWKKETWQTKPYWQLHINGTLRFECREDAKEATLFHQLMENNEFADLSFSRFFGRITDYHLSPEQRDQALTRLSTALINNPTLWKSFQIPFYPYLSRHLNSNHWPTLDLLKIHQLDQKTPLLQALKNWISAGLISTPDEKQRINRILNGIHYKYEQLGQHITPLAIPFYNKAYQAFQQTASDGFGHRPLLRPHISKSTHSVIPSHFSVTPPNGLRYNESVFSRV